MWRIGKIIYYWTLYPWRVTEILEWTERQVQTFLYRITQYKENQCTIAVVGLTGQGKSSFVNSVHSALKDKLVFPATTSTATGNIPTTKGVEPYFFDVDGHIRIRILDCQGYGDKKDKVDIDEFNIETMKTILKTGKWQNTNELQDTTEYAVNAVILCVEYSMRFTELTNKKLAREIVRLLADYNIPVFLMITHIDLVEKNKKDFIVRHVFKDSRFEDAVHAASDLLKIDENRIILQCNYNTNDQTSDVEKNILTLHNLCFVLETVFSRQGFF